MPVERLTADAFDDRLDDAIERQRAIDDDLMFGPYGEVRDDLARCSAVSAPSPTCGAVIDRATKVFARSGVPEREARAALRSHLGW